jgi:hypothetical protein
MRWLRRLLVVVLGVVVLVTLVGAGWVVSVDVENSRDERAFIQKLDHSVRGNLCAGCPMIWKFPPIDDDFLIAEGDRACAWLHDQPYPWWSRAERFTFDGLMRRYLAANPVSRPRGARAPCGRTTGPSLSERPGTSCAAMRWSCTSHTTRSTVRLRPTEQGVAGATRHARRVRRPQLAARLGLPRPLRDRADVPPQKVTRLTIPLVGAPSTQPGGSPDDPRRDRENPLDSGGRPRCSTRKFPSFGDAERGGSPALAMPIRPPSFWLGIQRYPPGGPLPGVASSSAEKEER